MKKLIILFLYSSQLLILAQDPSTWNTIQSKILDVSCVDCHYEGSSFANQSDLVLTAESAYLNLIDVIPHNSYAEEDGLVRISSIGGQPGLEKSFLWEKINVSDQEHYYEDHANYGSLMPLGGPYLTNGELKFIEEWIFAGAPNIGIVADESILNDTSRFVPKEFIVLEAPEQGFQLHVGPVDIWPAEKHDREFLYFQPIQTSEELYMTGYEISMRPGSHHYIVYNYQDGATTPSSDIFRDMRNQQGTLNLLNLFQLNTLFPFKFFVGTQTPYIKYSFPKGIALALPPGSGFDHNLHSVNRTSESKIGEVYTNIYTTDKSNVEHIAYNGNFSNYDINLPPNQITTLSKIYKFDVETHLIQIWSHAHEKMTEFKIERVGGEHDGELIYFTKDWEHPPYLRLDPPMTFSANEGVKLVTTYNNWENRTINYGTLSSDEMQFMFYIYFTGELTDIETVSISDYYSLSQNYPNPFNPTTAIKYSIPAKMKSQKSNVKLVVYDILGNEVAILVNEIKNSGNYEVNFNANKLASGVYFYKLTAGYFTQTKKMILLK